jgi:hypothetical protein
MNGPEGPKGNAYDIRVSPSLRKLIEHLAAHSKENEETIGRMCLLLGVSEIAANSDHRCLLEHLVMYIADHGADYGVPLEKWREMYN